MSAPRPALVVFQGGASLSPTPLETLVDEAQQAATLDLLQRGATSGLFDQIFLVTDQEGLAHTAQAMSRQWESPPLLVESAESDMNFHFGNTLKALCAAHGLERVVYAGGGSMPLGTGDELRQLALAVSGESPCVVSNNLYSADVIAFWPASTLDEIELPPTDNNLAWLLHYQGGLPFAPIPRRLQTDFDIDTPVDLATMWYYSRSPVEGVVGPKLSSLLEQVPTVLPLLARKVEEAYRVMSTRRAEVLVAGRVNSLVWRRLEVNLPCQTRIISEERGMQASGREARGEVISILGSYVDLAGIDGLFSMLEKTCQAAFIDSRVLFAHNKLQVSRPDRFASDAMTPGDISLPWVREFTEAAAGAAIPVLLGGHSLISGGVWALSERVYNVSAAAGR
jgi:CTP:molybdopterin cytidylyltransferase MocA